MMSEEQVSRNDRLINIVRRLLKSGQYSDITITCGRSSFKAHRAVICPKSKFFEAACKKGFKVSTASNALAETLTEPFKGRRHRSHRFERRTSGLCEEDVGIHV